MNSCNKIIGGLKFGEIGIIFVFLERIRAVLGVFRGACIVANFFTASLCARNCIPGIKLLAISKTDEVDFFAVFEGEWGCLNVFRGTCIVANFFTAILRARNGIPAIKLLAISKTAKFEFFSYFWSK